MTTHPDSPAFPFTKILESDGRTGAPTKSEIFPGLTKREYMALHLMQRILPAAVGLTRQELEDATNDAIIAADTLIRELSK